MMFIARPFFQSRLERALYGFGNRRDGRRILMVGLDRQVSRHTIRILRIRQVERHILNSNNHCDQLCRRILRDLL